MLEKKTKRKKSPPKIKIEETSLAVDILNESNNFYVDQKFEKIERELGEIKGLISTRQDYESSFHIDFKRERDLLNKGFKWFCFIVLILNAITLFGVLCVILLNGFLWMEIQDDYLMYLALMCFAIIIGVVICTLLTYYVIRTCFIKRKISKFQISLE